MKRPLMCSMLLVAVLGLVSCEKKDIKKTGLVKLSNQVYAMIANGPTAVEGLGANSGFVVGTKGVLVIDTRYTPALAYDLLKAIRSVTNAPILYAVNTHYHPDHTWGNSVFKEQGATIVAAPGTREELLKYSPVYLEYYRVHKPESFGMLVDVKVVAPDTVFRDGAVVNTVNTGDVTTEKVVAMMVGREMKERFPQGNRKPGDVVLEVRNLAVDDPYRAGKKALKNVSFTVRRGEILGIAGLMGSGRSELVTTIFGEYGHNRTGELVLDGQPIGNKSAREAMINRISLVPEDRKRMGLIVSQSILKNISLPNLHQFATWLSINKHKELEQCERMAKYLAIKTPSFHALVDSLSGGNQQKVVIAKWLMSEPKVLILDEPTRGIDVGAKYEIYKLMNSLAEEGVAIIMVSSDLPEILGMSDRILVMHEGECTGILDRADATQEKIMALATGLTTNN